MSERKIGDGTRRGDGASRPEGITERLSPSRESVADTEIGLYGTQTQGEIAEARGGPGQGPEQESADNTLSLDDLRKDAKSAAATTMTATRENDHGQDRGGPESNTLSFI